MKLEYCVQSLCPYLRKRIDVLEKIKKRAIRTRSMVYNKSLSYTMKDWLSWVV